MNEEKWSKIHVFIEEKKEKDEMKSTRKFSSTVYTENKEALDTDIKWVEEFNQCEEWFD